LVVWLVVAILAAIGEVLTTGLYLAVVAAAAAIAAVLSLAFGIDIQLIGFAAASTVGLLLVRPFVVHTLGLESVFHSLPGPVTHSTVIGRQALVTQSIDAGGGQIRIGQGEFWTARPLEPGQKIPAGTSVQVALVEGLTALVEPVESEEPPMLESEQLAPSDKGETS